MQFAVPPCYLSPEGRAVVAARAAQQLGETLAMRRALRQTYLDLDLREDPEERRTMTDRRASNERRSVDRRGAVTIEIDGHVVMRPAEHHGRFDDHPHEPTAFRLDNEFRA